MRTASLLVVVLVLASSAAAQDAPAADPNPGAVTLTSAMDVVSTYMFRGIRQHSTGLAVQPFADVGVALLSGGTGAVSSVTLNVGTWNSLHSGDTGGDSSSGNMWYEQDFYTTFGTGFGATAVAATFTAYTSPNASFTTVREIAFRATYDDTEDLGAAALHPYALLAFEFMTEPGVGQADGGDEAGTYLELGVAPSFAMAPATIAVPVKLGLSVSDYYERRSIEGAVVESERFGFLSIAAIATLPLGSPSRFGAFSLRGGGEYQRLGDATAALNGGDENKFIGSVGITLTY